MVGEGAQRAPRRVHLETQARGGDIEAQWELDNQPECPPLAAHLWRHFLILDDTRSSNGMAICRLTRREIREWQEDTGVVLDRWEREAIIAIDAAYCSPGKADEVTETA
jgi:hypothetical protein